MHLDVLVRDPTLDGVLRRGFVGAQPRVNQQAMLFNHCLVIFPRVERRQIVLAHDDAENNLGMRLSQMGHGVRRKIGARQGEFDVSGLEVRMVSDRQMHHLQPMLLWNHVHPLLVRTARRHNKPNFIQSRQIQHVIGNDQMPQMNWIERPEVQPDPQLFVA